MAITFLSKSEWCSHYGTPCTATSSNFAATTVNRFAREVAKWTWESVSDQGECVGGAFLSDSSRKADSREECKKSCEALTACRSITYYKGSDYCSHYGHECTDTKFHRYAASDNRVPIFVTTTAAPKKYFQVVGKGLECDESSGEVYLKAASGNFHTFESCRDRCGSNSACKSFTYYKGSDWCSLWSTPCTATRSQLWAISQRVAKPPTTPTSTA